MITYSGRSVWPTWTDVEGVPTDVAPTIEDIAVGLGRQSRFAGQTREFYTVLCHSLVAGTIAHELYPEHPMLRRWLLLHDGHEAMIADVPTTWKNDLTRGDEYDLDVRIAAEHGLDPLSPSEQSVLKMIDGACLAAEAHALGHREAAKWWPQENWDDFVSLAHRLTQMQLVAGNPVRYLDPGNSIPALKRALQR
jgi:hypothetical protein